MKIYHDKNGEAILIATEQKIIIYVKCIERLYREIGNFLIFHSKLNSTIIYTYEVKKQTLIRQTIIEKTIL